MEDSSASGDSASRSSDGDSSADGDSTVNDVAEAVSEAGVNNNPNAAANEMLQRENALRQERLGRWSSNQGNAPNAKNQVILIQDL